VRKELLAVVTSQPSFWQFLCRLSVSAAALMDPSGSPDEDSDLEVTMWESPQQSPVHWQVGPQQPRQSKESFSWGFERAWMTSIDGSCWTDTVTRTTRTTGPRQ
jgi:hypothetical protein